MVLVQQTLSFTEDHSLVVVQLANLEHSIFSLLQFSGLGDSQRKALHRDR